MTPLRDIEDRPSTSLKVTARKLPSGPTTYKYALSTSRAHFRGAHPGRIARGYCEEMESRSSSNTSTQTMTITSRLIAILSSIPRQGFTVADGRGLGIIAAAAHQAAGIPQERARP